MGMMPGVDKKALANVDLDDKRLVHIEAMITSMTAKERENPDIINGSRKKRIAAGSGTTPAEINAFLKQFNQMRMLMKQFSNPKKMKKLMGGFKGLF
jgi:signal recognition particle subunit SRP54